MSFKRIPLLICGLIITTAGFAQQSSHLHITGKFPIKSAGGWDYITVDGKSKRIFVSHGTQVNILTTSGDSVGVIPNTNGVHGIALVKSLNKGYTSDGRNNSCTVFDLTSYKLLNTIAVGTNPDAIFYDDYSKKVFVFNGKSKDASVIDPVTDKVVATIPLGRKPETGVSDGKGKVYVNSETTNEVVVINANTYKAIARYKIQEGDEPSGLAIDRVTNRLFIGCGGNQTLVVMDAANGKNLAKYKIGDCDGVAFDPSTKMIYTSNNEGTLSVIKEVSANKFEQFEDVKTEPSARTIGLDILTHKIYLPAAKTEPGVPTAANPKPRAKSLPGSFHIIEISK
ncbi:YncE family protein [Mucilaginibacter sp. KACC 22063]|uniref:YncE family protein n=1 Tax=Mucilaginibacter sp. KACC 22063 TaxID=3025666 RepID=UPI002365E4DD|nr:YncE family protein [Mucilaginibacter sp. KACC 22063]WDF55579.1 YncE family protein [Mucilaginibacter sp. KACC 22063]